ncbi:membrane-bound acid phosphatase, putative [Trypanosoma brucei gambiense DAL972]|uniref:Membrane-bound acid phosphatase, putative n=1 Tax=Trypanosoma brucei gambiense (strain MHOM/CI/86/DAL972) TaxID=679716 RepID=D0A948_TRYB9|nr:membrane-bound acid phosphatase, putative [Trypanosoma brucei gambiense DAL972]CBH18199.1 membrane-bound acid phosphatase, putative [Trypanosoma brucei gambiense DAL972]|eukprot:XP_011780463.1 membrane-bound acid phosphatase, putative [Trypanosoma brucei gambiense DAL972]
MMRPLSLVWWAIFVLLAATGANCSYVLELVQVVHRGGITPPPVGTPDREKLCSPDSGSSCAAIANHGVQQLIDMGAYIEKLYKNDDETEGAKAWLGSTYDSTAVYTHSFADPALVQAATALLKGIYAEEQGNITPAVISAPPADDTLLNVNALPSFVLGNEAKAQHFNKTMEEAVDEQFPDSSVIGTMGREVGLSEACSSADNRVWCCHRLQQLATMYSAMKDGGSGAPTVMENVGRLDAVATVRSHTLYGYSTEDELAKARGSLGQPLAQELLLGMRRKMLQKDDVNYNTHKVMQYVHNTPIRTTVGYQPTDLVPVAETFLIDLLRDDTTEVYFVRLRHAVVKTEPAAMPSAADFPFRCVNAAGDSSGVKSKDGFICPFDDFVRFVDSSKGTGAGGAICHLDTSTADNLQCSVVGPPTSPQCERYRRLCPRLACPDGHIYDVVSGMCTSLYADEAILTGGVVASLCIALLFSGVMLGIIMVEMYPVMFKQKMAV